MPTRAQGSTSVPVETPTTWEELNVMAGRRDELTAQLQSLGERQSQLVNQRYNATVGQNPGLAAELDVSLREIQARIGRIEREKLATDDAIATAIARGIRRPDQTQIIQVPDVPPPGIFAPPRNPTDRLEAFGGFVAFSVIVIFGWRWLSRRRDKLRDRALPEESAATKDLRVAVETIALEVERISEGQRFITKLLAERGQVDPALLERGRTDKP